MNTNNKPRRDGEKVERPMSATWRFYKQQATDPIHNPIAGEFFSTEAVGNVTEGLIGEGF